MGWQELDHAERPQAGGLLSLFTLSASGWAAFIYKGKSRSNAIFLPVARPAAVGGPCGRGHGSPTHHICRALPPSSPSPAPSPGWQAGSTAVVLCSAHVLGGSPAREAWPLRERLTKLRLGLRGPGLSKEPTGSTGHRGLWTPRSSTASSLPPATLCTESGV